MKINKNEHNGGPSQNRRYSLSAPLPMDACFCLSGRNDSNNIWAWDDVDGMMLDHNDAKGVVSALSAHAQGHSPSGHLEENNEAEVSTEKLALKREMASLTLQEQESARRSVQGILSRSQQPSLLEDPDILAQTLYRLQLELNTLETLASMRQHTPTAYSIAIQQNPNYVQNRQFRLGFLRAERYDASKAAQRLCRYLEEKLDIFGPHKLTRDILLNDLGEDGILILQLGGLQILPQRDQAGRRVVFGIPVVEQAGYTIQGARKAHFYFWTSLAEDDDELGRIRGIVGILWRVHRPAFDPEIPVMQARIRECAPVKISAYHLCHGVVDTGYANQVVRIFLPTIQKFGRLRYYRAHYGAATEIQYTLYTQYGCPSQSFPFLNNPQQKSSSNALFHIHYVQDWLVRRIQLDEEKKRTMIANGITFATSNDEKPIPDRAERMSSLSSLRASMRMSDWDASMMDFDVVAIEENDIIEPMYTSSLLRLMRESVATIEEGMGETRSDDLEYPTDDDIIFQSIMSLDEIGEEQEVLPNPGNEHGPNDESSLKSGPNLIPFSETCNQDVLLGRGRPLQKHPGNLRMRKLIADRINDYEDANKHRKTEIAESIVQEIYRDGGRFLKQHESVCASSHGDGTVWEEIDDHTARLKVSYTFRTFRKMNKRAAAQDG